MNLPQNTKPALAKQDGQLFTTYKKNQDAISNHAKSGVHSNIISRLKKEAAKKQRTEISQNEQTEETNDDDRLLITAKMFRSVFVLNKLSLTYSDHAGLVMLQKANGIDMGYHHYERSGCTKMSLFMSDVMHDTLIEYLMKNKRPISIIVDGTTDLSTIHYMIVYLQTIEDNMPVIYFYKLIELKAETGLAHFETIHTAFESEKVGFVDYMKNNLIGFASDGAANNIGVRNGFIAYLRRWVSKPVFAVHCMAHRLELVVEHAFTSEGANIAEISTYLDKTLNEIYSFYSHSHKRKTHLKQTADSMKKKFYELKKIIEIRWVASDYNAMKSLHSMWGVVVRDLGKIADEKDFKQSTRDQALQLKFKLIGKQFLALFNIFWDIVSELSLLSLDMQRRSALLIDASSFTKKFKGIFSDLKTKNAKNLATFLHEARCMENDEMTERCETLENYVSSRTVYYENYELVDDKEHIDNVLGFKDVILHGILKQFDKYFPDGDLSDFNVLDPMNMSLPNYEASTRTYGIAKIGNINDYFKIANNDEMIKQWQA